ncbi:MAG: hypothetical protein HYR56_26140 [Acidobacteria bacterium]|nr:hypothetical protein [Acidobacteriota bacterium]MBI3427263.1 hypothetical protein [Acidobacteriota bacterium]
MLHPKVALSPKARQRAAWHYSLTTFLLLLCAVWLVGADGRGWRTAAQIPARQARPNPNQLEEPARREVRLMEFDAVTNAVTNAVTSESRAAVRPNRRGGAGVSLRWRTGYEADNLGFNLYRTEAGERVRVNPTLIAGSALLAGEHGVLMAGQSYAWNDAQGVAGDSYWLEVVELSGATRWHGPVYATGQQPAAADNVARGKAAVNARLLSEINVEAQPDAQREWAGADTAESSWGLALNGEPSGWRAVETGQWLQAQNGTAASIWTGVPNEKAAKLAVRKPGWYRVTAAELTAIGFNPNVNPAWLRMFADGSEAPIKTTGKGNRVETVEFYGRGNDLPSTDTRVYWLVASTLSTKSALRIEEQPAKTASTVNATSYLSTIERKDRSIYFSGLFNGDAENWFGPVVSNNAIVQALNVKALNRAAAGPAQLELTLQGVTGQAHTVLVEINGQATDAVNFTGPTRQVAALSLPVRWLLEGDNEIRLLSTVGSADISLVESVRLRYPRRYVADADALNFSLNAGQTAFINGFSTPNIRVLEITGAALGARELLVRVQASGAGFGFALQSEAGGSYLALADNQLARVAGLTLNQPSNWRAPQNGAELVIVTHRDFRAAADRLATARRLSGINVAVVDVEDAYDEFACGTRTPAAVKDLLSYARANWSRQPKYALFIGDATQDPRNYLGLGDFDFVPTKLGATFFFETALDNWFADADGDALPELALGRLPVRTAMQAEALVTKLVSFKPALTPRGALLVSDRAQPGLDFRAENERLAALLPPLMVKQFISRDDGTADQVRGMIVNSVNQAAPLVVNWLGHGSTQFWTGDGLLRSQDAPALTNTAKALFVMTTCLNGYFIDPSQTGLSEAVLVESSGGAFATVGTSALIFPEPALLFNQALFQALFGEGKTLGEAMTAARLASGNADVRNSFVLFGDPTMRVR